MADRYQAFISYRHADSGRLAVALEKALRQYAKPLYKPPIRIFRDEKQIGAGQDLRRTIERALDDSAFLLYIATRGAAESPYVCQELDYWCGTLRRQDRLIIVWQSDHLVADPVHDGIDWATTDALPASLAPHLQGIPVWLDLTWAVDAHALDLGHPRFKSQINLIVARFRGVAPEELNGEEIRVHRRNIAVRRVGIAILALAFGIATTSGIVAWQQWQTALAERDRARSGLLVNAAARLAPRDFTLALGFAVEAYALRLPAPPLDVREALLQAFYARDGDFAEPYQQRLAHGSAVTAAAYSRDGGLLATGSSDGMLSLWSADGGLRHSLRAHDTKVLSVAFAADVGQVFTTALMDTAVKRFALDGTALAPVDYDGAEFAYVSAASTGQTVHAGFGGENYRHGFVVWGPARDEPLRVEPEASSIARTTLRDTTLSRDGDRVIGLLDRRGRLRLVQWDAVSGEALPPAGRKGAAALPTDARFRRPVFGSDRVYLDISDADWQDLAAGPAGGLVDFVVSPDGQRLLRTTDDGTLRVWDAGGRLLTRFELPDDTRTAALLDDPAQLITLAADAVVTVRDLSGTPLQAFRGHAQPITALRLSPDAQALLTASADGTAKLWRLHAQLAPACKAELADVDALQFAPDGGERLLLLSRARRVVLWRSGQLSSDSPLAAEPEVYAARFSPDGRRIVTLAGARDALGLWDRDGNPLGRCCGGQSPLRDVVFSPDGQRLLTLAAAGGVRLWDADGAAVATLVAAADGVVGVRFSPQGEQILTFGLGVGVRLWDNQRQPVGRALPVDHEVTEAAFSADGKRLLLWSPLGGISLWDAAGGQRLALLEADAGGVYSARWIGDGKAIVSTHVRGRVKVWDRNGMLREAWVVPSESGSFAADAAPDGSVLVVPGAGIRSPDGVELGRLAARRWLAFMPTGDLLVAASHGQPGEVAIHDRQGTPVTALGRLAGHVVHAEVSPDAQLIAILSDTGQLALRCTAAGIYQRVRDAVFYRPGPAERAAHGIDWLSSAH